MTLYSMTWLYEGPYYMKAGHLYMKDLSSFTGLKFSTPFSGCNAMRTLWITILLIYLCIRIILLINLQIQESKIMRACFLSGCFFEVGAFKLSIYIMRTLWIAILLIYLCIQIILLNNLQISDSKIICACVCVCVLCVK